MHKQENKNGRSETTAVVLVDATLVPRRHGLEEVEGVLGELATLLALALDLTRLVVLDQRRDVRAHEVLVLVRLSGHVHRKIAWRIELDQYVTVVVVACVYNVN